MKPCPSQLRRTSCTHPRPQMGKVGGANFSEGRSKVRCPPERFRSFAKWLRSTSRSPLSLVKVHLVISTLCKERKSRILGFLLLPVALPTPL